MPPRLSLAPNKHCRRSTHRFEVPQKIVATGYLAIARSIGDICRFTPYQRGKEPFMLSRFWRIVPGDRNCQDEFRQRHGDDLLTR